MADGVVIDTNVFVSALRSRRGASHRLAQLVGTGCFELELSAALVLEYEDVGIRLAEASGYSPEDLQTILNYWCGIGRHCEVHYRWRPLLIDPGDDMVAELAIAAGAPSIVTFNGRDFRGIEQFGIRAVTPQEFLQELEKKA